MSHLVVDQVKGVVEGRGVGEDVRIQEIEQRVQLVQVVLERRPRQQQHVLPPAFRNTQRLGVLVSVSSTASVRRLMDSSAETRCRQRYRMMTHDTKGHLS